jgi:hypothetical protein
VRADLLDKPHGDVAKCEAVVTLSLLGAISLARGRGRPSVVGDDLVDAAAALKELIKSEPSMKRRHYA